LDSGLTCKTCILKQKREENRFLRNHRFPKRIILVRHGESLGNAHENAYTTIPDWKIPLTNKGREQSKECGQRIKEIVKDEPLAIYCSPYLRTKQTLAHIMECELRDNPLMLTREEPRVTEQQFGNFQKKEDMESFKRERSIFGRFYYRFPQGESGLDVYNRVTLFIGTLFREWEKENATCEIQDSNVLIVTHGLTLRLFLMRWFQYSVEEFESSTNLINGGICVMTRKDIDTDQCLAYCHHDDFKMSDVSRTDMNFSIRDRDIRVNSESNKLSLDTLIVEAMKEIHLPPELEQYL
jgi:broad specificity phosphatase PhoE